MEPDKAIFIASTQRSGSNLLCSLMAATHSLGYPDEYLNDEVLAYRRPGEPCSLDAKLRLAVAEGITPNRVLSLKVHADQLQGAPIDVLSPKTHWLFIERLDRLGQAISWEIARQTGTWHSNYYPSGITPEYDRAAISQRLDDLERYSLFWREFFRYRGVEPLRMTYEDVAATPEKEVFRIAAFASVRLMRWSTRLWYRLKNKHPLTGIKQQRSELNERWRAQYLSDGGTD